MWSNSVLWIYGNISLCLLGGVGGQQITSSTEETFSWVCYKRFGAIIFRGVGGYSNMSFVNQSNQQNYCILHFSVNFDLN